MKASRRALSIKKKLFFATIVLVGFYTLLELTLRLAGVQSIASTDDPFVGFQKGIPLFLQDKNQEHWQTNPSKLMYFNNQSFPTQKSNNTFRAFCLGGSTTFGHPFDYRTSFSNWLQNRLEDAAPEKKWEIINCGGISYASYRVCVLMEELNKYQPDLYIVYTGHNEFLESRTYDQSFSKSTVAKWVSPVVSNSLTASAIASAIKPFTNPINANRDTLSGEVDAILDRSVGPVDYKRDLPWRDGVVAHYRNSIERICRLASKAGARVVFITPASNERDCSPFKSEHGNLSESALERWNRLKQEAEAARASGDNTKWAELNLKASDIDPVHAQGLWETGVSFFATGDTKRAKDYFQQAIDEDICPLRATSAITRALAEETSRQNVPLINFPSLLSEQHSQPLQSYPFGDDDFLDHLHPTIEAHRILAWEIFEQMARWKIVNSKPSDQAIVSKIRDKIMLDIDSRTQALAMVQVIQVYAWAGKVNEALKLTEKAEEIHPGLSEVASYRGRMYERLGDDAQAMYWMKEAVERNKRDWLALSRAGTLFLRLSRFEEARAYLATAVLNMPTNETPQRRASCRFSLGLAFYHMKQWKEASIEFGEGLKLLPDDEQGKEYQAIVLAKLRSRNSR